MGETAKYFFPTREELLGVFPDSPACHDCAT